MFGKVTGLIYASGSIAYLVSNGPAGSTKVESLAGSAVVYAGELPSSPDLRRARLPRLQSTSTPTGRMPGGSAQSSAVRHSTRDLSSTNSP